MPSDIRYFLNIKDSFSGLAWTYRLNLDEERIALSIAQTCFVPEIVARVLAGRGIKPEQVDSFLNPTIRKDLPCPLSLTDMEKAAQRIVTAILKSEKIAIFGDYDVDGAASCAVMKRFFNHFGLEAEIYIPDRIFEGYGPNPQAMKELASRASLIITVDCGVNSIAAIAAIKDSSCSVVVLDHHQVSAELPEAFGVVNPNREDDLSGQGYLCATGVVFLTLVEVSRILRTKHSYQSLPDLLSFLDLVALATVCDMVALTGINRAFVVKGLLAIRSMRNKGLAALSRVSAISEPINSFHLSFLLGPRINAGGRIGDAALGARLLSTNDSSEALQIAETLDHLNRERRSMEKKMLQEAISEAEQEFSGGSAPSVFLAARDSWHAGLVGLIAARLKEHTRRPCFAVHFYPDGTGVGSGRSIPGFDLGSLVRLAVSKGLLIQGGGHAMAAGIRLNRSCLADVRAFFHEQGKEKVDHLCATESLTIDAALSADSLDLTLLKALESAGPYGVGHPSPIFVLPYHTVTQVCIVGEDHIKVDLMSSSGKRANAIGFRCAKTKLGSLLRVSRGKQIHLAGTPEIEYWQGKNRIRFRILDAAQPTSLHG